MTQAEKTMLRYEYTMQRLGMAQGDFVRTQHTWANQVRVLRQQFQALGAVIGQGLIQALKPALIAFNQFLSRVIEFAKKVLNALGKIFGWKVDISGGGLDTDLSEAEDAATGLGDALGGAGDSAGDAADNVKELKKQLQGFDKLNVLTTTETGGGSGGSGGGGGGSGSGGGGGGAGSTNDIAVNLQKTEGLFESDINNLRELGVYIRNALMDAMDNIPWESIYEKARGFGSGLASFLNGLFSGSGESNVFASLGRTVAGAINTALNFFDSFADVFDFSTFGRNLASFFVEAVANIDWSLAGEAFHEWMQGIKDAFVAFVKYLGEHKEEVFQAIKDFLSEITIEDIGIFIAMITITKIGKWVLTGGVYELAKKAIGALFKDIGIAITAKITGLSFAEASALGAKGLIGQLIGSNGIITNALGLALLEGTGAATVGGALATFALPIAFAITPLIFHKILRNMYEDAKEEGDEVKQSIIKNAFGKKASVSRRRTADGDVYDVELGAVINWKVLFGKLTDKLPWKGKGFFKWLAELLFPKTVKTTNGKDLEIDYSINLGFKLDTKFGKGKFSKWLEKNLGINSGKDTVTATTGITKGRTWDSGKKEYQSVHDETATKTIAGRTNTSYSQRKTDFNNFKSNTATKTIAGATANTFNPVKTNYNGVVNNTATKTIGGSATKSFWNARSYFNGVVNNVAWKSLKGYEYQSFKDARSAFNSIYNKTVEVGIKAAVSNVSSTAKNLIKTLFNALFAEGGIKMASGWQPITAYASGGMPSSAEVFMARENGLPEMVGRIGNHTAVMNNDQIVASVASGVAMAVSGQNELLIQQNSLLRQILAKETGISSRDIFDAVRSENNNYINRTGNSAFA